MLSMGLYLIPGHLKQYFSESLLAAITEKNQSIQANCKLYAMAHISDPHRAEEIAQDSIIAEMLSEQRSNLENPGWYPENDIDGIVAPLLNGIRNSLSKATVLSQAAKV